MAFDFSIGEVARRTGVRPSALRYYEEAGILPAPARVGGRRRYDADVIRRVDLLRFAQQAGFTLDEIKTLFHGFSCHADEGGTATQPEVRLRPRRGLLAVASRRPPCPERCFALVVGRQGVSKKIVRRFNNRADC